MQNYIYSCLALSSLFAWSSLALPADQSCRAPLPLPIVPEAFSILAKTWSNRTQYLGVLQPLDEGTYYPARTFPDPQQWSLLPNGSLTTNTTNGTLAFLWKTREVTQSQKHNHNMTATGLYVGSWTDASNYKLAHIGAASVCVKGTNETELLIGDEKDRWLLSNDTAGPLITIGNTHHRNMAGERVTFIVAAQQVSIA